MRRVVICSLLLSAALLCSIGAYAQDKTVRKVIELGQTDNRTMQHDDFLSNRIGGRLIGSHALEDAEKWVAKQFREWGYDVQIQEVGEIAVGFNRGPWSGRMLSEDGMPLHFVTPAYTAGTKGPQKGHVVIEPKTTKEFEQIKGKLKGAWVLVSGSSNGFPIDGSADADAQRAKVIEENDGIYEQNMQIRYYNFEHRDAPKAMLPYKETPAVFYRQMVEAGVLGFIQAGDVPLKCHYDRKNCFNITMETLPTVCDIKLDREQYEIIRKKVETKRDFLLEFDIRNHFSEGPVKYHNIIATMKGSKYPGEYVLAGGHLDAYDAGTGAVDDGQGTSVTMEAARLLAAAGAKPKRSVMFCIWTGEEYGLFGSKFFVENKTVPLDKISNYFNRDGGPEAPVSVTVTPAMYDDFVEVSKPVADANPDFPFTVKKSERGPQPRPKTAGGSDHAYFAMNGVPTVQLDLKDVKGYGFEYGEIWHTENDRFDKCIPEYMEYSSVVTAVLMYGIANLDHLLSREGLYND